MGSGNWFREAALSLVGKIIFLQVHEAVYGTLLCCLSKMGLCREERSLIKLEFGLGSAGEASVQEQLEGKQFSEDAPPAAGAWGEGCRGEGWGREGSAGRTPPSPFHAPGAPQQGLWRLCL